MTTLIELTIAKTEFTEKLAGERVYVNPANIAFFHTYPYDDATVVAFVGADDSLTLHVKESVDGIYEAIYRAEHPGY